MKNSSKAGRGKVLENYIMRWFDQINRLTQAVAIRLEVNKVSAGGKIVYQKKQPFDFLILSPNGTMAFDAKECKAKKMYWSKVPEHQKEALTKLHQQGKTAGFVIWFKSQDPLRQNLRLVNDFSVPATIESGERVDFSVIIEQCQGVRQGPSFWDPREWDAIFVAKMS